MPRKTDYTGQLFVRDVTELHATGLHRAEPGDYVRIGNGRVRLCVADGRSHEGKRWEEVAEPVNVSALVADLCDWHLCTMKDLAAWMGVSPLRLGALARGESPRPTELFALQTAANAARNGLQSEGIPRPLAKVAREATQHEPTLLAKQYGIDHRPGGLQHRPEFLPGARELFGRTVIDPARAAAESDAVGGGTMAEAARLARAGRAREGPAPARKRPATARTGAAPVSGSSGRSRPGVTKGTKGRKSKQSGQLGRGRHS